MPPDPRRLTRRFALLAGLAGGASHAAAAPSRKPAPAPRIKHTPAPVPPKAAPGPVAEAAPVPDRAVEGPRAAPTPADRPSLAPSIIHRRLPGRGLAAEGSPSNTEDRLFAPAPGARLSVPFAY